MPVHHTPSRESSRLGLSPRARLIGSAIVLAALWLLAFAAPAFAQSPIVEEFFVPVPENDIFDSFKIINSGSSESVLSETSIAIGGDTQIV